MAKSEFTTAYDELQTIIDELNSDQISIDELSGKVKRAQKLIKACRNKLRNVDMDIQSLFEEEE